MIGEDLEVVIVQHRDTCWLRAIGKQNAAVFIHEHRRRLECAAALVVQRERSIRVRGQSDHPRRISQLDIHALWSVLKKPLPALIGLVVPVDEAKQRLMLAAGLKIGKSLAEADLVDEAKAIIDAAKARGASVPIPTDVVTAKEFSPTAKAEVKAVADVQDDEMILDIGPETAKVLAAQLEKAGTIVWNGPVGVFEFDQFGNGTKTLADAIARSAAFSIAGGGDTLAAIAKYGIHDKVSYISTGGGAFLEFLEGKKLPAVEVLESRA